MIRAHKLIKTIVLTMILTLIPTLNHIRIVSINYEQNIFNLYPTLAYYQYFHNNFTPSISKMGYSEFLQRRAGENNVFKIVSLIKI